MQRDECLTVQVFVLFSYCVCVCNSCSQLEPPACGLQCLTNFCNTYCLTTSCYQQVSQWYRKHRYTRCWCTHENSELSYCYLIHFIYYFIMVPKTDRTSLEHPFIKISSYNMSLFLHLYHVNLTIDIRGGFNLGPPGIKYNNLFVLLNQTATWN